jgi:acyl dehydratase
MVRNEAELPDVPITEEMMTEMRSKFGLILNTESSVYNEYATRLAILRFAESIGDTNPLWSDEKYGMNTRFMGTVAPPSFVWACLSHVQFGWAGLGGFHGGCDIEFFKPVYVGDRISVEVVYDRFDGPKSSQFAGEILIDQYHNNYRNQLGQLVAMYRWWIIRVARAKAREKGKYSSMELPHRWTKEQLKEIEAAILSEELRGAVPRYWEDVHVGDSLGPVVKGPLGITDIISFCSGGAAPTLRLQAHGAALRQYQRHPAWAFRDPNTYALEPIFAVHYSKAAANAMGLPFPYNIGIQTHCWGIHLLTNWMGDEGWLKRSQTRYLKFIFHSDIVRITGAITKKYVDDEGEFCIDIDRLAVNQRNEQVMSGQATVALPSRDKNVRPLDKRLR